MTAERHIGISFGQIRSWHDGLGEFSLQLGQLLAQEASAWQSQHGVQFHFHLPKVWHGHFGPQVNYLATGDLQRWVHWQPRSFALWHSLQQFNPFKAPIGTQVRLQTVHDANFLYLKKGAKQSRYTRRLQRLRAKATEVITISQYGRADLQEKVGYRGPIRVIYNGVRDLTAELRAHVSGLAQQAYFLHISRLAPSKNVGALLNLAAHWPEKVFVLAGGSSPYSREVAQEIAQRRLSNVHLFLDISDAQKTWLYANCEAFLFPSQAEGFGLPPIEAMHFGKPVFLSLFTSLPEVGGAWANYWDDLSPQSMRLTLEEQLPLHSPQRAQSTAAHARSFNWADCASAYMDCYQRALKLKEPSR